jgi:hypothetical protein
VRWRRTGEETAGGSGEALPAVRGPALLASLKNAHRLGPGKSDKTDNVVLKHLKGNTRSRQR